MILKWLSTNNVYNSYNYSLLYRKHCSFTIIGGLQIFARGWAEGTLSPAHLLWHGASVFEVSSEGQSHRVAWYDKQGAQKMYSNPDPHVVFLPCQAGLDSTIYRAYSCLGLLTISNASFSHILELQHKSSCVVRRENFVIDDQYQ